jgi:hypothetical protein
VSVTSSASRWWTFKRQTAFVVDTITASASVSVDRQPSIATYLQVGVSGGTTGSGSVTLTGTDQDGVAASETLAFAANGVKTTTTRWLTLSTLTTTGLADEATVPNIGVEAVAGDGGRNLISYTVAASRPVMFSWSGQGNYPALTPGSAELDGAKVLVDYEEVWTPRVDDLVYDDQTGDAWVALSVRPQMLGFGYRPDHYEVRLTRFDT